MHHDMIMKTLKLEDRHLHVMHVRFCSLFMRSIGTKDLEMKRLSDLVES
jgi:hypothetical protein